MTEVTTPETLTLWRRDDDRITNAHLHRLTSEGWSLIRGEPCSENDVPGYEFTFERRVVGASEARLIVQ